ncbi:MAG: glycosyltransferase family 1 protein [Nocardioides sp.]
MDQAPETAPGTPVPVVLSMLTLVPGGMGGSETYARAVTRELAGRSDLDVSVLLPESAAGTFDGVREVVLPQVRGSGSTLARLETAARAASPRFRGRRQLRGARVVHYPLTVPVPRVFRGTPRVQTVHDVQHRDLPELFSAPERAYRALTYDRAARRSDKVITISRFCQERLTALLGVDPQRIAVAPLGVDADAFVPNDGPRQPFVLYPARAWPHKNHPRLVEAMALVRDRVPDLRLVLTGGGAEQLGPLPDWVEHRGLVPDAELRELYRGAACLAFPSLYEGFGLPPLEAMASGCPVASSTSGSLPEVCGDAAVMFDPLDVGAMATAIHEAIDSRERLVPLALRRARLFTWQACADAHAAVFHELAGG